MLPHRGIIYTARPAKLARDKSHRMVHNALNINLLMLSVITHNTILAKDSQQDTFFDSNKSLRSGLELL